MILQGHLQIFLVSRIKFLSCSTRFDTLFFSASAQKPPEEIIMRKLLAATVAVTFALASTSALAYVGGNTIPKPAAQGPVGTNKKHTNHGVGGNSAPVIDPKTMPAASKNRKHTSHGVGGNSAPVIPPSAKK
jgi:hypothetical protein